MKLFFTILLLLLSLTARAATLGQVPVTTAITPDTNYLVAIIGNASNSVYRLISPRNLKWQPADPKLTNFVALANGLGALTNNGAGVYGWFDLSGLGGGSGVDTGIATNGGSGTNNRLTGPLLFSAVVLEATNVTVYGGLTNSALAGTGTRLALANADGKFTSGPVNAVGVLTNNGSGGVGFFDLSTQFTAQMATFQIGSAKLTNIVALADANGALTNNGAGVFGYFDLAGKQPVDTELSAVAALANGNGALTNNGSGVFGYFDLSTLIAGGSGIPQASGSGTNTTLYGVNLLSTTNYLGKTTAATLIASNGSSVLLKGTSLLDVQGRIHAGYISVSNATPFVDFWDTDLGLYTLRLAAESDGLFSIIPGSLNALPILDFGNIGNPHHSIRFAVEFGPDGDGSSFPTLVVSNYTYGHANMRVEGTNTSWALVSSNLALTGLSGSGTSLAIDGSGNLSKTTGASQTPYTSDHNAAGFSVTNLGLVAFSNQIRLTVDAGQYVTSSDGIYAGLGAGRDATNSDSGVFLGYLAGQESWLSDYAVKIGRHAGYAGTDSRSAVQIGHAAGQYSSNSLGSVQIGYLSSQFANQGFYNVTIGNNAGQSASNSSYSVMIGRDAGQNAVNSSTAVMLGFAAGKNSGNSQGSVFIGNQAGQDISRNNTLVIEANTAFATNATNALIYGQFDNRILSFNNVSNVSVNGAGATKLFSVNTNAFVVTNGNVGIGTATPTVGLDATGLDSVFRDLYLGVNRAIYWGPGATWNGNLSTTTDGGWRLAPRAASFVSLVTAENRFALGSSSSLFVSLTNSSVGIGINAPTANLHVVGTSNIRTNVALMDVLTNDFVLGTRYTNEARRCMVAASFSLSAAVAGTATVSMFVEHGPTTITNRLTVSAGPLAALVTIEPLTLMVGPGAIYYFADEDSGSGATSAVVAGTCSVTKF